MRIRLNGEGYPLKMGLCLSGLILELGLVSDGIAVAINGEIIPRATHPSHELKDGDEVEIIQAVGGG